MESVITQADVLLAAVATDNATHMQRIQWILLVHEHPEWAQKLEDARHNWSEPSPRPSPDIFDADTALQKLKRRMQLSS